MCFSSLCLLFLQTVLLFSFKNSERPLLLHFCEFSFKFLHLCCLSFVFLLKSLIDLLMILCHLFFGLKFGSKHLDFFCFCIDFRLEGSMQIFFVRCQVCEFLPQIIIFYYHFFKFFIQHAIFFFLFLKFFFHLSFPLYSWC